MKILVIGSGGREHALVWKVAQNTKVTKIFCAPGNAGMALFGECVDIAAIDADGLVTFAKREGINFVIIGPDAALEAGVADAFESEGIDVFGPRRAAAVIEYSKVFSKAFMKRHKIPTADYEAFTDFNEAKNYIENNYISKNKYPIVIKADGLAAGKGVIIAVTADEAREALKQMLNDKLFGASGESVVIEEYMEGVEMSVLAFCDGKTVVPMESAQDHKRAYDNDEGPNTGGMGAFSPSRFYTDAVKKECMEKIFIPTVKGLAEEGIEFKGVIFFGLMLTDKGVKVVEYNARFGDPETQVVLPRLKTDLLDIMKACVDGTLDEMVIEWRENAVVCVVMASDGYPGKVNDGYEVFGLDASENLIFHAGTKLVNGKVVTAGGRVLAVVGEGADVNEAAVEAYNAVKGISFQGARYRNDIGVK